MKRLALLLATALAAPLMLRAELPEAVRNACFSAVVIEKTTNSAWAITSWQKWTTAPMRITEAGADTIAEQDGAPNPNGWATTSLALRMPPQTDEVPYPTQQLTLTLKPTDIAPKATTYTCHLLHEAALPPCSVKQWGKRLALVADEGDWYLAPADPAAKITIEEGTRRVTISAEPAADAKTKKTLTATLLVGEGPLPAPLPLSEKGN